MATVILTQPYVLTAARDPAWFEVQCDGYLTTAPSAHYVILLSFSPFLPTAGDLITVYVPDGRSEVFEAVAGTPDDSGRQYQIGVDTAATHANLLAAFQNNYLLSGLYLIEYVNSATMQFTARTAGAGQLVLDFSGGAWCLVGTTDPGSDGDLKANYRLGIAVYLETVWGSGIYQRLPEFHAYPDPDQRVSFDLHTLLKPYLNWHWPSYNQSTITRATDLQRRYYIERWESYGDPPQERQVDRSSIKRAIFAGTQQLEHDQWVVMADTFINGVSGVGPFMSYRDRGGKHEVSAAQQHYLGWYCNVARVSGEDHQLAAQVYYTDGTNTAAITSIANGSAGVQEEEVGIWPTGFDRLSLGALEPTKTPYKYRVRIVNDDESPLSEWHTFYLVEADVNELHIEFVSSLGVTESIRTVGSWVKGLDASYTQLNKALKPTNGVVPSNQLMARTQRTAGAQPTLEVFGGYVDATELQALLDIAVSPDIRLVDHVRGTKSPLRLLAATHEQDHQGEDGEWLYALNLKFEAHDPAVAWSNAWVMPSGGH